MSHHIGRSWEGTDLEDRCPCPQQPCGLVALDDVVDECEQHPPARAKTIRQGHSADDCPRRRAHPAGEGPAAYAARLRVVDEASKEAEGYISVGLLDVLDEYRQAVQREYAHELAERIRSAPSNGLGSSWDWWDAATIPDKCADLIDPEVQS